MIQNDPESNKQNDKTIKVTILILQLKLKKGFRDKMCSRIAFKFALKVWLLMYFVLLTHLYSYW